MGYARKNRGVRRAVATEFRERGQFRIVVPEDVSDTRKPFRLARVHTPDPRVSVGRGQEPHAEHAGKLHIHSVDRGSARLLIPIDTTHAALTDVSVLRKRVSVGPKAVHLLQYLDSISCFLKLIVFPKRCYVLNTLRVTGVASYEFRTNTYNPRPA